MMKFIRNYGKQLVTILTVMVLVLGFTGTAFAIDSLYNELEGEGNISDRIQTGSGADEKEILTKIDEQVSSIVTTVRVIATIFAVVFIIWIGITFVTSGGHPQKLMQIKSQIVLFFLSLVFIFMAEPIVRFVLSWFI